MLLTSVPIRIRSEGQKYICYIGGQLTDSPANNLMGGGEVDVEMEAVQVAANPCVCGSSGMLAHHKRMLTARTAPNGQQRLT